MSPCITIIISTDNKGNYDMLISLRIHLNTTSTANPRDSADYNHAFSQCPPTGVIPFAVVISVSFV